jgi:hypothetical protein
MRRRAEAMMRANIENILAFIAVLLSFSTIWELLCPTACG